MAKLSAQEFAKKWSSRTTAAVPEYRRGIERVQEAPGLKAAQAVERYRMGIEKSIAENKWQDRVQVPLAEWKEKALNKGANRIAAGVTAAENNVQRFAGELLSFQDSLKSTLDASNPRGSLEDNINRSAAWQRGMSKFRKSG